MSATPTSAAPMANSVAHRAAPRGRRPWPFSLGRVLKANWLEIIMLTPLVVYILGFTVGPVLYSILLSLRDKHSGDFPTLANYVEIIGHGQFSRALFNTVFITFVGLAAQMSTGLVMALMLNQEFRGRGLMRALLLIPLGVPTLVSAVNMSFIFGTSGYLNELLYRLGLARVPIDWSSGGIRTLLVVVMADLWKVMPIVTLLLLAGLETIPGDVYEAGAVDGATAWQRFRHITFPLLKPSITMALILRAIDVFRIFDLPLVLAGRVTPVVATYAYFEYFAWNNEFTSAAAATILLGMILVFTFGYLLLVERQREGVN